MERSIHESSFDNSLALGWITYRFINMPTNSVVTVKYGPYESCGIVEHRTFRLDGLQAVLKDDGHQCVLEKTDDWNIVEIIVNGECVYTCNITDLEFGGDGRLDPRCQEAIDALIVHFSGAEDDPFDFFWVIGCGTTIWNYP
uniref:Chromosome 10 open reading frame 53 n=1 Tax=Cyprinus carpio carpio TaxID=630221 RepID=A0A8C1BC68_CYPCA